MLDRARIQAWDLLLVGDGSGSGWQQPSGWAVVLVDRLNRSRELLYGGISKGSINLAESLPYLHALSWFHATCGRDRLHAQGYLRVHVITDSEVVCAWGNQTANPSIPLPTNVGVWAGMREFGRMGYQLQFHWAARNTTHLNLMADLVASLARREVINQDYTQLGQALGQLQFAEPNLDLLNPIEMN